METTPLGARVKRYEIVMLCDSGTMRLTNGTAGCYWERVYHHVTWCAEYTLAAAVETMDKIIIDGRWVRGAWIRTILDE